MSPNFNTEIDTILIALKGSPWATDPTVQIVIQEYGRLVEASKRLRHRERKPALQILFSSRAIDTLIEYVVNRDRVNCGKRRLSRVTIGNGIHHAKSLLDPWIIADLEFYVRDKRNHYLHEAGIFPTNGEMELFLLATAIGISELVKKIP